VTSFRVCLNQILSLTQLQSVVAYNQSGRIIHIQASQTTRSTRSFELIRREDHLEKVGRVPAQAKTNHAPQPK
ncbi:MAG: hypothetical protein ACLP5V_06590, partial [Candidatus Bathyarchaeia archaeon]